MSKEAIYWRVNENLFTDETYPGCTPEEYDELNKKLLNGVIKDNPDESEIDECIQRHQEKLHF